MNARILIVDEPSELYGRLVAATLAAEEVNNQWFGLAMPEDTGLGFMEFFDWLAGTTDRELFATADSLGMAPPATQVEGCAMTAAMRHELGLTCWRAM